MARPVELAGEKLEIPDFYEYSFSQSVTSMWSAEAYILAVVVAVMSGVWPYAKLLVLAACWMLPPTTMSPKKRGKAMLYMDFLGKWSLIDLFVVCLAITAAHLKTASPAVAGGVVPASLQGAPFVVEFVRR